MAGTRSGMSRPGFGWAIAAPLGTLALAYGAWALSDQLLFIGPIDRAQFGWLVVIPLMTAAPVVAVFAWRNLDDGQTLLAATTIAVVVGTVAGLLFGLAVASDASGCQYGTRLSTLDIAFGSAVVGIVAGAGYAGSGAIGAVVMRKGSPWLGGAIGAIGGFVSLWAAAFAAFVVLGGVGICNRPI
jgi:hypothetical protein